MLGIKSYLKEVALMAIVVAAVAFSGLFMLQTNRLIAAVDELRISYSSHNDITAHVVNITDGTFDVAENKGYEVD
jgi:hypothetical protein